MKIDIEGKLIVMCGISGVGFVKIENLPMTNNDKIKKFDGKNVKMRIEEI